MRFNRGRDTARHGQRRQQRHHLQRHLSRKAARCKTSPCMGCLAPQCRQARIKHHAAQSLHQSAIKHAMLHSHDTSLLPHACTDTHHASCIQSSRCSVRRAHSRSMVGVAPLVLWCPSLPRRSSTSLASAAGPTHLATTGSVIVDAVCTSVHHACLLFAV